MTFDVGWFIFAQEILPRLTGQFIGVDMIRLPVEPGRINLQLAYMTDAVVSPENCFPLLRRQTFPWIGKEPSVGVRV